MKTDPYAQLLAAIAETAEYAYRAEATPNERARCFVARLSGALDEAAPAVSAAAWRLLERDEAEAGRETHKETD
jgi:hypothetical protein